MLLSLVAGASAFGTSVAAAANGGHGKLSLFVAAMAGAVLGVLAKGIAHTVGERVATSIRSDDGPTSQKRIRILYVAAVLWIFVAGFLAHVMTRSLLGLFVEGS
jgi:hypothetical protein